MAKAYLTKEEYNLFCQMSSYDKKHSVKVLKKVLENDNIKEDIIITKLSLLHDIGKAKNISFFERILHVMFKSSTKLKNHPKMGYNKLNILSNRTKEDYYYEELKKLVLNHHKENTKNKKLIIFQKIDDMC
ncbi:MAG: HD domain-containing protein [Fusobacteriota bacterium]